MGDYKYLNDALGVPGEVVAVETMTVQEIKKEVTQIIEDFEEAGYGGKLNNIPECPEKQRLRDLLRSVGFSVEF